MPTDTIAPIAPLPLADGPSLDLSVVIVTHRTPTDVRNCLETLTTGGGMSGLRGEIIVIDNASNDGTAEMIRADFPNVRLIANAENLGFSRGNNQGMEASRARNVLLLNPDTLVPDGALAKCVGFLEEQDETVAAMTCRVQSVDGTYQWTASRRFITPWSESCRALLLDRLFKNSDLFNREQIVGWDRRDTRPVECLLGAFMLIRHSALEKLGGLDERFFLMYEDADWCKRAVDAGYRLLFWPNVHITHIGGQFWKQEPVVVFANAHLSAMTYFAKHHPRSLGVVRAVSRFGMELKIALLRLNLLRKPNDSYTLQRLEMARAARQTLKSGNALRYGKWAETNQNAAGVSE